jgi:hypothetical protein
MIQFALGLILVGLVVFRVALLLTLVGLVVLVVRPFSMVLLVPWVVPHSPLARPLVCSKELRQEPDHCYYSPAFDPPELVFAVRIMIGVAH